MSVSDGWYMFDTDFNRLIEALKSNGVWSGLQVQAKATPAQAVDIGAGEAYVNGKFIKITSTQNLNLSAADATNPRKNIVTLDENGTLAEVTGTPQAAAPSGQTGPNTYEPKPPDIPANKIILAEIWRAANDNTVENADITDRRVIIKPIFETQFLNFFGGFLTPFDAEAVGGDTGYSVSKGSWLVRVQAAGTANYIAWIRWRSSGYTALYSIFDLNPQFEFYIKLTNATTLADVYIFMGDVATSPTGTAKKFGVHIANGALRIMSADGSTWSETADLMTLSGAQFYVIRVKLFSGSKVEVWVDRVSKGTKATNLPSGSIASGQEILTYYIKTGEAAVKTIDVSAAKLIHD